MIRFFSALVLIPLLAFSAQANDERLIVVNGIAERSMEPNLVMLTVEIWSKASNAKIAQQNAANEFQRIKKVFEAQGIRKEDIATDNYSLNPEYVYDNTTQSNKMVGFRAVQSLAVTSRKVENIGGFLDALVSSNNKSKEFGVNINNIRWDSDQRSKVELSALAEAVQNTRKKAEEIAKASGVKIKNVYRLSHSSGSQPGPIPFAREMKMAASTTSTELAAGVIKVQVEVQSEYSIQ